MNVKFGFLNGSFLFNICNFFFIFVSLDKIKVKGRCSVDKYLFFV